jgi:hypothetical protein
MTTDDLLVIVADLNERVVNTELALSYHAKAVEQSQILLVKLSDRVEALEDDLRRYSMNQAYRNQ